MFFVRLAGREGGPPRGCEGSPARQWKQRRQFLTDLKSGVNHEPTCSRWVCAFVCSGSRESPSGLPWQSHQRVRPARSRLRIQGSGSADACALGASASDLLARSVLTRWQAGFGRALAGAAQEKLKPWPACFLGCTRTTGNPSACGTHSPRGSPTFRRRLSSST